MLVSDFGNSSFKKACTFRQGTICSQIWVDCSLGWGPGSGRFWSYFFAKAFVEKIVSRTEVYLPTRQLALKYNVKKSWSSCRWCVSPQNQALFFFTKLLVMAFPKRDLGSLKWGQKQVTRS
jgi:hypothetical protein